jgi:hypothetical protein
MRLSPMRWASGPMPKMSGTVGLQLWPGCGCRSARRARGRAFVARAGILEGNAVRMPRRFNGPSARALMDGRARAIGLGAAGLRALRHSIRLAGGQRHSHPGRNRRRD